MSRLSKLLFLVVSATALFFTDLVHAATITVSMTGFQFVPKNQIVNVGDTVMWVNREGVQHDTVSGVNRTPNGIWRSSLLNNGGSFSFTFTSAGVFPYYCTPHALPPFNMTGTITVVAPNASPAISITNPVSGAIFTAGQSIVIQANASDDNRVARVEFFANGASIATDFNAPFSATLENISSGNYALTATAFDDRGLSGNSQSVAISVRDAPSLPTISSQPQSQNVLPSAGVIFSVVAGGTPPLTYQWQFNGTNISGATSDRLELTGVQTNAAGNYVVLVSNDVGTTPSAAAILTVTPLPNIFPTVTVTSPADGSRFRAGSPLLIRANPLDADGFIVRVEIFLNGNPVATFTNAPYEILLNDLPPGVYSVTARATDDSGDATTSDVVHFSALASPTVTIVKPMENEKFILGTNILFVAAVDAPGLSAISVQIFKTTQNGALPISPLLTNAPYTFIWTPAIAGAHSLVAVVTDEFGGKSSSAGVSVLVVELGAHDPTITITESPKNFSRVTNAMVLVRGVAHDDVELEKVEVQVNEGPFFSASGTDEWEAAIALMAGTNVINFRSVDLAGNVSTNATRTYTLVVNTLLLVEVQGLGIVSPNLNGRFLEIGKFYQMIARPSRGQIFGGWDGNAISNKAVLNFAMQSNLVLTANFIPNPFLKGLYAGLIHEPDTARAASSGFIKIAVTKNGSFTGKITIAGRKFPLRGAFDYLGRARVPVLRRPLRPVLVTLQLDLEHLSTIAGGVTDGHWISSLSAEKVLDSSVARERIKAANREFNFQPFAGRSAEIADAQFIAVSVGGALKFHLVHATRKSVFTSYLSESNAAPIYFWLNDQQPPLVGEARLAPRN